MDRKIEFIYLTEEEMIQAGVTDMASCIDIMEEVFQLLAIGDYVMGGQNNNSHGIEITFPKTSPFPNMPVDSPDRRFMAMCAYLGGRFNICGEKWYGSNIENRKIGLPRSIHTIVLNNQRTGAPIAIMPGNLISSMRTGAVPGVGAKYLARPDAATLGLVGAGVISKACAMGILTACEKISTVKVYDLFKNSAIKLCDFLYESFNVNITLVDSVEDAIRDADVVNISTSGSVVPKVDPKWLKAGMLLSLPANVIIPHEFVENTKVIVDNWKMYESWIEEYNNDTRSYHDKIELIGGDLIDCVLKGSLNPDSFINLGDIVEGNKKGRDNEEEIILLGMGGMPVEDVAWAYQVLENARTKGLGTNLRFWDEPHMI